MALRVDAASRRIVAMGFIARDDILGECAGHVSVCGDGCRAPPLPPDMVRLRVTVSPSQHICVFMPLDVLVPQQCGDASSQKLGEEDDATVELEEDEMRVTGRVLEALSGVWSTTESETMLEPLPPNVSVFVDPRDNRIFLRALVDIPEGQPLSLDAVPLL